MFLKCKSAWNICLVYFMNLNCLICAVSVRQFLHLFVLPQFNSFIFVCEADLEVLMLCVSQSVRGHVENSDGVTK